MNTNLTGTKGIKIDGTHLKHLRLSDDVILIREDLTELKYMLEELKEASNEARLEMNLDQTKMTSPTAETIAIENCKIKTAKQFIYLDHSIKTGKITYLLK